MTRLILGGTVSDMAVLCQLDPQQCEWRFSCGLKSSRELATELQNWGEALQCHILFLSLYLFASSAHRGVMNSEMRGDLAQPIPLASLLPQVIMIGHHTVGVADPAVTGNDSGGSIKK